ncbi:MAG: DNA methyltransferase [Cycloclasticus sp.]|nr:DNA methyltransferase [Cycloclasticus sp.]MBG95298.1 DNA methyltransferase [Cycloclasticus sp.]
MQPLISDYLERINTRYQTGISREHAYRGDLQYLLEHLLTDVLVTNEPARIDCGSPDYILTKNDIPVGFIEAKDIGKPLDSKEYKEQFDRYKKSLSNLIITDYLDFQFYLDGEKVTSITLATIDEHNVINPCAENFKHFEDLIKSFATHVGQNITSPTKLSKMMAGKAKLLANIIEQALKSDTNHEADSTLKDQMEAFKSILIHDITNKEFADVYAQTIAYGMFAARLHDKTLNTFSRQEAAELIPKSNPFLRKLFQYIAGYDLDDRIVWIIDSLADIFRATDVNKILRNFGKATRQQDPIIHFYETFLAEYDPKLRKSRGVWYTPTPVVNFIVRAVDDILKTDFNLKDGLADTSKTTIEIDTVYVAGRGKNKATKQAKQKKDVHKVQILDPATGTGTFLAETIKHIHDSHFQAVQGAWSQYVEQDLIPRINGFEILMASYAMAHLKLELLLEETGYKPVKNPRLNVYLTNSLEEHHPDTGTLFASWLSNEASEANYIKRDTPVMVVMGNPPYSVSSSNKGDWINDLLVDYKRDLNEKNIQPLSDDYIKFIRYGQHYIEKNGEGVLAYISNNSFIDGVIHRQMRKHILETFDTVYILDLHGNSKKQETAPEGSKDENVFDIMQGVSINIFVKTGKKAKGELAKVFHSDLFGLRQSKYDTLQANDIRSIKWQQIEYRTPEYFFVQKDLELQKNYENNISVNKLMPHFSSGISTHRDKLVIDIEKTSLISRIKKFYDTELSDHEVSTQLKIKDNRDWKIIDARAQEELNTSKIQTIEYRPFDTRHIYYEASLIDFCRNEVMQHFIDKNNYSFNCLRQSRGNDAGTFFVSNKLIGKDTVSLLDRCSCFPLYIYPTNDKLKSKRIPNMETSIIAKVAQKLNLEFTDEKQPKKGTFAPIDVLDYIYAVLHSPSYRNTYKEFLKMDFPRVPYPNINTFWDLVALGGELRQLHLLESSLLNKPIASYPIAGNNEITRKFTKTSIGYEAVSDTAGKVWINDEQYFDNVPLLAWEFYIGGYQPAQKWLKDRHGRTLNLDDIRHYLNIVTALVETDRLMKEIDQIGVH